MSATLPAIVFDLDGTLVDSADSILASFRAVLTAAGIAPVRALDASLIGPPLLETLRRISGCDDAAELRRLADAFKASYDGEGYKLTRVYDGVDALLRQLAAGGHRLYIATNKRLLPTRLILDHLRWTPLFAAVFASDLRETPYRDKAEMLAELLASAGLDAAATLFVGDTEPDAAAAAACGVGYLHVGWGYAPPSPAYPCLAVCASAAELLARLRAA